MSDEQKNPLTRTVEVAEGPNATAHADQATAAHATPEGEESPFVTNDDGSKSVRYADAPQRREED